jgi:HD-GYP domain-containing protein (c-di-GMP phosphodiesterase class II)
LLVGRLLAIIIYKVKKEIMINLLTPPIFDNEDKTLVAHHLFIIVWTCLAVGWLVMLIARDPYTAGHQIRSAGFARAIATEMGLSKDKIDAIRMAGSIHDIGKLSIPAEILSKPTKLSEIEFSLIKAHAERGFEMLKDVESPWPLAEIVYQHHERMDGSGYPRNLKGEEILIEARILNVADVVEAMASHRPYRPGLGIDAALSEIEKNRGIFYDIAVADACLRLFREKGFKLEGA